jgi:uncharacterized protein YjbI with pentapeptide repeats
MMNCQQERRPPESWSKFHRSVRYRWLLPLLFVDWLADWAAYGLSRLSLLELLEYCGSFSILIAVIFYFMGAQDRAEARHYQAWQVINTAQGKGGSGGRIDALRELNEDRVPLVGVDVADAFLQGVILENADLRRGNFHSADMKGADLAGARFEQSVLAFANLRQANLTGASLLETNLSDCDLNGACLKNADFHDARFDRADLRGADLSNIVNWRGNASFRLADVHNAQNAPAGFIDWAKAHGAVDIESDDDWNAAITRDH